MKNILLPLFLLGALVLQADPLYWPASPRVPAATSELWMKSEGPDRRTLRLSINGTYLDLTYMGKFAVGPSDPRWNASLIIPEQPAVRCGFTIFDAGTWMPGTTKAALKNYILGLQVKLSWMT